MFKTSPSLTQPLPVKEIAGAGASSAGVRETATGKAQRTIVVIGNGMVGHRLCSELVERKALKKNRVIVFGEENRPAYDRVNLTKWFDKCDDEYLELAPRDWYARHGIETHLGDPVVDIDRERRIVRSAAGREVSYDRLVFATGSAPFVPPIPGITLKGVFVYRTIDDLRSIAEYREGRRVAAVIGGGLLGLEAAKALKDMGMTTHVIELARWLMPQQLSEPCAAVLTDHIGKLGVHIHAGRRTQRVLADGDRRVLEFEGGDRLTVDMVVISAGIRARDELARLAGIKCDTGVAGIMVDDRMVTSDPNVFAVGECAVHRGRTYGLVAPGLAMADTLADNLTRRRPRATFERADLSTRLKLMGVDVAVFGAYRGDGEKLVWSGDGARRELVIRDRRIVGAVVVGQWDEIGQLRVAIDRGTRFKSKLLLQFEGTGSLWPGDIALSPTQWPESTVVCNCMQVTVGQLRGQVVGGCRTVEQLATCTRASTMCGSCGPLLAEFVGADVKTTAGRGWKPLLVASIVAAFIVLLASMWAISPIPFADSVQSTWHQIDVIWRDGFWKQVSGFSLLGVAVIGLSLSLRKRIKWLKLGKFGWWRVVHAVLGVITLLILIAHTGFRMGANLNFALMAIFLGLSLAGAAAGVITALEANGGGRMAVMARRWRPVLTWAHILLFWPLPVLLGFHIAAAYYF